MAEIKRIPNIARYRKSEIALIRKSRVIVVRGFGLSLTPFSLKKANPYVPEFRHYRQSSLFELPGTTFPTQTLGDRHLLPFSALLLLGCRGHRALLGPYPLSRLSQAKDSQACIHHRSSSQWHHLSSKTPSQKSWHLRSCSHVPNHLSQHHDPKIHSLRRRREPPKRRTPVRHLLMDRTPLLRRLGRNAQNALCRT